MPKAITLDKETINRLYHLDNLKLEEVAQTLGVCKDTIRRNMRRYGIPPKASEVYRKGQDTRIIRMLPIAKKLYFDEQRSFTEVYQTLGISFYTLQRLFADNGLAMRASGDVIKLAYSRYPHIGFQKGVKHSRFNGYRATKKTGGYILVYKPDHHRTQKSGYVGEHILVWEDTHGIPLPDRWVVHHLNGIKNDNRPENLVGLSTRAHSLVLAEKAKRIRALENMLDYLS